MPARRLLTLGTSLVVATLTALAPASAIAAPGAAAPSVPTPNASARQHGLDEAGDATMGWTTKPDTASAPVSGVNPKAQSLVKALDVTGSNAPARALAATNTVAGLDLSEHTQGERWDVWKSNGVRFAYIKASEGDYYTNDKFSSQYVGATKAGVLRGGYHFANPSMTNGTQQADYFIAHGGGWSPDGRTLPGALDMEWNPYAGNACYNKSPEELQRFVIDFVGRYKARTGTRPVIYTAKNWWNQCMGSSPKWWATPLWIADYHPTLGALPDAWAGHSQTIWQNAAYSSVGYDTNLFNGSQSALVRWATRGA